MTIGWGPRTICGVWLDTRSATRVINLQGFGWHYQIVVRIQVDRWKR